jgi:hypothetical protein
MIQPKTECRLEVRLIHNTSRPYRLFRGGLLDVTAELISHGGEQFIREVCLSTEGNPHARLVEEASDPSEYYRLANLLNRELK